MGQNLLNNFVCNGWRKGWGRGCIPAYFTDNFMRTFELSTGWGLEPWLEIAKLFVWKFLAQAFPFHQLKHLRSL